MDTIPHEEVSRSLFRESNDGFFLFDPTTLGVIDLNPAAMRLTGHDRQDVLRMRVTDLFRSDDPRGIARLIDAYRKTGVFHSREDYALRRADGELVAVNLSASRIHTDRPMGLVVVRDISERRKAQMALERFFQLSPALFAILSAEGSLIKTNRAWETVLGYTPEDLRTVAVMELIHPEDRDAARQILLESGGEVVNRELRALHKDGSWRWLSWSASKVDDSLFLVAMDITFEKEAAALRQAKEAAEMASRAKGQFLSSMSHELRTPLTAILALVDVFLTDPASRTLSQDRQTDLRTIQRNGEHLLGMINSVLDLARIESGKLSIERVACRPRKLVDEVAAMMRPRSQGKGLSFQVQSAPDLPEIILTDPIRLRQILINLVGNAVKFTPEGSVTVSVESAGDFTSPRLRFRVMDTGMGIATSDLVRLFEPFEQMAPSSKTGQEGSGLGLAISRRLAEALGGTLSASSKSGAGSVFELTIPAPPLRQDEPLHQPDPTPAEAQPAGTDTPTSRVLLAEDNADNRRAIAMRLEQSGLNVSVARDGEEAIETTLRAQSQGQPFDVILMDMQMPVVDGYEATRQLRQKGFTGKIVALTAYALEEDRLECLRFGCDFHLSKPIEWGKLLEIIHDEPSPSAR